MVIFIVCRAFGGRKERNRRAVFALGEKGLKTVDTSVMNLEIMLNSKEVEESVEELLAIDQIHIFHRNVHEISKCEQLVQMIVLRQLAVLVQNIKIHPDFWLAPSFL